MSKAQLQDSKLHSRCGEGLCPTLKHQLPREGYIGTAGGEKPTAPPTLMDHLFPAKPQIFQIFGIA